jgi:hypothetical protein
MSLVYPRFGAFDQVKSEISAELEVLNSEHDEFWHTVLLSIRLLNAKFAVQRVDLSEREAHHQLFVVSFVLICYF